MSVISVSKTLAQATGLLVQALEGVVFVAPTTNNLLTVSAPAAAVSEASDLIRKVIIMGIGVAVIKGAHIASSWWLGGGCNVKLAIISTGCEDWRALANVGQVKRGADQLAGVVLTLLLAVARKDLIIVNGVASIVVALQLVGNHLVVGLTGNVDRDERSSRGGGNRDGSSGVGDIGKDSIILLNDHGGECLSRNLQEEDREDDKESESLVGGENLSVWKAETSALEGSVQVLGDGLTGKTRRRRKTYRHDHPSAMACLKGWMNVLIGLGMAVQRGADGLTQTRRVVDEGAVVLSRSDCA